MLQLDEKGNPIFSKRPTLGEIQGAFELTFVNIGTWTVYARRLNSITEFFGSATEPKDIFRHNVEEFANYLRDTRGLAASTIRNHMITGSSWFRWMQHLDIVDDDHNPFLPLTRKPRVYKYGSFSK